MFETIKSFFFIIHYSNTLCLIVLNKEPIFFQIKPILKCVNYCRIYGSVKKSRLEGEFLCFLLRDNLSFLGTGFMHLIL